MIILWKSDNPADIAIVFWKLCGLLVKIDQSGYLKQVLFFIIFFASYCSKNSEGIGSVSWALKSRAINIFHKFWDTGLKRYQRFWRNSHLVGLEDHMS